MDEGRIYKDFHVGQTGKTVAPDPYIAVGISDPNQNLVGMKNSKVTVAINKDEKTPSLQGAGLFKTLPELAETIIRECYT